MAYQHPKELVDRVIRYHLAGASSPVIGDRVGLSAPAVRGLLRRYKHEIESQSDSMAPSVTSTGVHPTEFWPDPVEVRARAEADFNRLDALRRRQRQQEIVFSHGPAAVVFVADIHFGAHGCNVKRAFEEAELIAAIPGAVAAYAGDGRDSFIMGKLMRLLMEQSMSIEDEIVLFNEWLRILGPALRLVISGNHDIWVKALTGVPYLRETAERICPAAIYADFGTTATIRIGDTAFPGMARHSWGRGGSIYNETHSIEAAFQRKYQWLRWGVGAHKHTGGVTRSSNIGGTHRVAVMCGTYKPYDDLAQREALAPTGNSTAVGIVYHEDPPHMVGFDNLELLAHYMHTMYTPT